MENEYLSEGRLTLVTRVSGALPIREMNFCAVDDEMKLWSEKGH